MKEFIKKVLLGGDVRKKIVTNYGTMHYSYEKPNDGVLQLEWDRAKISAFLRSMDYGVLRVMGTPYIIEENKKYCWDSYGIIVGHIETVPSDSRIIRKEDISFILNNYCELISS